MHKIRQKKAGGTEPSVQFVEKSPSNGRTLFAPTHHMSILFVDWDICGMAKLRVMWQGKKKVGDLRSPLRFVMINCFYFAFAEATKALSSSSGI